jgi:AraC family transcriptional regulator
MATNVVFSIHPLDRDLSRALLADPRLQRLLRFVQRNLSERVTLARAAEVVGLERTYFSRFFRANVGCTFSQWNRRIRMERAKLLLERRGSTILCVAFSVGYTDLTTFERAFRKHVGTSPRSYRYACDPALLEEEVASLASLKFR